MHPLHCRVYFLPTIIELVVEARPGKRFYVVSIDINRGF
jgi:hypothetical protein